MRLYDLALEYQDLQARAEAGDDVTEALDCLTGGIEHKAAALVHVLRDLELDSEKLALEIKRLTDRKRAIDANTERMRSRLRDGMAACDLRKIKADTFTITLSEGPERVEVEDPSLVPADFSRVKTEVDKSKILAAYKEHGECVPGTRIARGTRLVIR